MQIDERSLSVALLAGGILLGLSAPPLTELLAPIALPALFFVILFSLMPFAGLTMRELVSVDPTVWRMVIWQQIIVPIIVIALAILLRLPEKITSLAIMTACAGSLFASPALAGLLNLDTRRALQCMVLSTLLMPLSLYFFIIIVHSADTQLNLDAYLRRVFIYLLVPFALFGIYRIIHRMLPDSLCEKVPVASRWGALIALLIFGIGIMDAVSHQITENPTKIAFYLMISLTLTTGMLMFTVIVMHRYGFKEALTAGILTGFRNVGLGLALVGDMVGPELAPYVGISMIPVFIGPMLIRLTTAPANVLVERRT